MLAARGPRRYPKTGLARGRWGALVYFKDSQILFLHPTKTGGTTVEHSLTEVLKDSAIPASYYDLLPLLRGGYDEQHDVKKRILFGNYRDSELPQGLSLQHACLATSRRLLGDAVVDGSRKIAIVRNPYARVLSIYYYYGFASEMTFAAFVQHKLPGLAQASADFAVNFAARQALYTHRGEALGVDLLLRQEQMPESYARLADFLGAPVPYDDRRRHRETEASRAFADPMDAYDGPGRAIMRELYGDDFRLLGYDA